jgi:hypothetical protein
MVRCAPSSRDQPPQHQRRHPDGVEQVAGAEQQGYRHRTERRTAGADHPDEGELGRTGERQCGQRGRLTDTHTLCGSERAERQPVDRDGRRDGERVPDDPPSLGRVERGLGDVDWS